MPTPEIPQIPTNPTNDPKPQNPDQERTIGDPPKPREVTASKEVDDLSRQDSKPGLDPQEDPRQGGGEKVTEPPKPGIKLPPVKDPLPGPPGKRV